MNRNAIANGIKTESKKKEEKHKQHFPEVDTLPDEIVVCVQAPQNLWGLGAKRDGRFAFD